MYVIIYIYVYTCTLTCLHWFIQSICVYGKWSICLTCISHTYNYFSVCIWFMLKVLKVVSFIFKSVPVLKYSLSLRQSPLFTKNYFAYDIKHKVKVPMENTFWEEKCFSTSYLLWLLIYLLRKHWLSELWRCMILFIIFQFVKWKLHFPHKYQQFNKLTSAFIN